MKLTPDIALVGSGSFGFDLTSSGDCHVYLIDGGDELALVDAGMGGAIGDTDLILETIKADGYDTGRISKLLLTHYHFDHCGGAAEVKAKLGCTVHGSPLTAKTVESGNGEQISLPAVKAVGYVPEDYELQPCPVVGDLIEGTTIQVGRLAVTVYETPGHCAGHVSLLVTGGDRSTLVQGDLVFFGGTISLQNIPDCSIPEYSQSVQKLAGVEFEAFLPGHLGISLRNGKRHIDAAAAQFAKLLVPKNMV
jgi:glyoxylase-like metal-dependent hydrolase (beta-lactamase superfamily II)